MKTYKDGRMEQSVRIRPGLKSFFDRRGERVNAGVLGRFIATWMRVLEIGEMELAQVLGEGIGRVVEILADQVRADGLNADDFWTLGADRIGAIVALDETAQGLAQKCFELSEIALLALKDRVNGVVPMVTGRGGRHAQPRGETWEKAKGRKSRRHR